jgi:hypothetical protein
MEEYFSKMLESRLQKAMEEFIERNELRLKELSLIERVVRVEEELKAMREMSELKFEEINKRFEALQRELNSRFEAIDKRFEALQRELDSRFEATDRRFEAMDKRFEALQREMNTRFEAMDKRFSVIQWMIGILVGIPALIIALTQVLEILR